MHTVVRKLLTLSLALSALFAAPAAFALDTGDIVVKSIKGEVHVTMSGAERTVRAGAVLELPASIHTGADGAIDLAQGATSVSVGPDTQLDFPALETRGGPIDKIVQPRGNAFYSIGKREGRRLRVETPYLVAVIKGTQFNVAALSDTTTISLFEGLLEIRASDDSSVVDIKAGEIAARKRGDKSISVMKMDDKAPPTKRPPSGASAGTANSDSGVPRPAFDERDPVLADRGNLVNSVTDNVRGAVEDVRADVDARGELAGGGGAVQANVNLGNSGIDTGVAANVNLANNAVDVNAGVSAGAGGADVSVGAAVAAGAAAVDVGANVSVGSAVGAGVNAGVNLGNAVDVGANAGVNVGATGANLAANTNVDLGAAAVNAGVGAGVGTGNISTNVDLGAAVNTGVAAVDAGANAAVNLGANNVNVTTNVDVGANVAGVAAGVNTSVNVATGNVDLGVNVAGVNLGVALNLGLDDHNNGGGNDAGHTDTSNPGQGGGNSAPPAPTPPVVDVGGLLDDLLKKRHKK